MHDHEREAVAVPRNHDEFVGMLSTFLIAHQHEIIERCKTKVAVRNISHLNVRDMEHGIATFFSQLVLTLQAGRTLQRLPDLTIERVSAPPGGIRPFMSVMGESAAKHGRALMHGGFSVDQVVHGYGDLCQAITELAFELEYTITVDDFQVLNSCLDNAIADAVTEYAYHHDALITDKGTDELNDRLGVLAHELRNLVHTSTLSLNAIKTGKVAIGGATGQVLDRSLIGIRTLVDRSLADVRVRVGLSALNELIPLDAFIAEARLSACLEAELRKSDFHVLPVDQNLAIDVDHDLLLSAVSNLLQNAFKFSKPPRTVSLKAYASGDRIVIEVADSCGGLAPGVAQRMFHPFTQLSEDRSGLGLGLSIAERSVKASNGTLTVQNVPGSGCIFTINLPRHEWPPVPEPAAQLPATDPDRTR
jgi:signal transduction histidine kinase